MDEKKNTKNVCVKLSIPYDCDEINNFILEKLAYQLSYSIIEYIKVTKIYNPNNQILNVWGEIEIVVNEKEGESK